MTPGPIFRLLALACLAPAILLAQGPERFSGPSSQTLAQQTGDYWEWRLAVQPELATRVGRSEHNDRWRDLSKTARDRQRADREEFLQKAMYLSPGNLNATDQVTSLLMEHELRTQLEAQDYLNLVQLVSQSDGVHNEVFNVIDQMPSRTVKDYENIVARLRRLPALIDQAIDLMREQLAAGLAQPAVVVDLTLDQLVAQSRPSAADSPLLVAFRRFPSEISTADQDRLRARAYAAYDQQFVPSWKKLETFLRDTYRKQARPQTAVTSVPNGRAAYAALIHAYTTTRMTAEQIHQRGLQEVARIEKEMERLARADGFTGPVTEYEKQLGARPGMRFMSQAEMIQYARDVLARLQPAMPRLFLHLPKMKVDVRPIPADREASAASNYTAGTADGTRPAWFNMNTYRPQEQVKYRTEALVLHETVPGHHLQIATARELQGLPEFRKVFTAAAFSEGWGLYAESLGSELGVYTDPTTKFGQLASEQFRAVRLVVDTGLHAMGWSRDRAREYFSLHVPAQSLAEVDRYIARPGQALAYKLGELKIRELRRRAEQAFGPRFDVRQFHDVVLRNGTLPLDLLEEQVTTYIATAQRQ
jgi:prolyl oligopeptidase